MAWKLLPELLIIVGRFGISCRETGVIVAAREQLPLRAGAVFASEEELAAVLAGHDLAERSVRRLRYAKQLSGADSWHFGAKSARNC
ncbi:MAG: hypothetical protein JO362_15320 [Streptomycetaceae bacterium]|nr:hypothetical protein [Streptomycetaceae bacterium]